MPTFSTISAQRLATCDERLQRIFSVVIQHQDCSILCGHRGQIEQEQAFQDGKSAAHWPQSKHNKQPSLAVDVAPYPIDWNNLERWRNFASFVMGVAAALEIPIRWGGSFKTLLDMPHFELVKP